MSVGFPQVRVGQPVRYQTLSVFPLFDGSMTPVEYTLSDVGIGSGCVIVEEVSETGSVPDLLVENKGDVRVLFLEGEQLVGAKQNRILNRVLVQTDVCKTRQIRHAVILTSRHFTEYRHSVNLKLRSREVSRRKCHDRRSHSPKQRFDHH